MRSGAGRSCGRVATLVRRHGWWWCSALRCTAFPGAPHPAPGCVRGRSGGNKGSFRPRREDRERHDVPAPSDGTTAPVTASRPVASAGGHEGRPKPGAAELDGAVNAVTAPAGSLKSTFRAVLVAVSALSAAGAAPSVAGPLVPSVSALAGMRGKRPPAPAAVPVTRAGGSLRPVVHPVTRASFPRPCPMFPGGRAAASGRCAGAGMRAKSGLTPCCVRLADGTRSALSGRFLFELRAVALSTEGCLLRANGLRS